MPICFFCKKSSHILTKCKCDNVFCLKHLTAEKHTCTHNYRLDKPKNEFMPEDKRMIKI